LVGQLLVGQLLVGQLLVGQLLVGQLCEMTRSSDGKTLVQVTVLQQ